MEFINKKLQVWHYPQMPCNPFIVDVEDEVMANKVINILSDQHLFLFKNGFIPDYCNSFEVMMLEDGEWVDYFHTGLGFYWSDMQHQLADLI